MIYNLRAGIVHNDRLCGYVLRSWPGTEKSEGISRRIFNPGSGEVVSTQFLEWSGAMASRTRSSLSPKARPLYTEPH